MVILKRISLVVLGLLVIAGLVSTLIWVPKIEVYGLDQVRHSKKISPTFYKRDVFTQEDRARQTLTTIVGGFLVLAGAYLTWRNVRVAEDKQLTDRFTAAVTNLSAEDKMAQRLGGIYALERIARDSPKDHWPVMEVLTAYVRDKRPRLEGEELTAAENRAELHGPVKKVLPTDIQAIMGVIRGRKAENDMLKKLDLREVDLEGADLRGASLRGTNMWQVVLARAILGGADLREAILWKADLRKALLGGAIMVEANLEDANLREANLIGANLRDADLRGADLRSADLAVANLIGANLRDADLRDADLRGADLRGTNLKGADLRNADLADADLRGADLREVLPFSGAKIRGTDLLEANLFGAKLGRAELYSCRNLTQDQLNSADQRKAPASLPPGFTFPGYVAPAPSPDPAPNPPPTPT